MRRSPGWGALGTVLGALLASACATSEVVREGADEGSGEVGRQCSRWSPLVQTHLMQAVVRLGGPNKVYVAGWTCGRPVGGGPMTRIVFLRFQGIEVSAERAVVPVIFEDGRLVGDGWELLERQPERYGTAVDVHDWGPPAWRAPEGWTVKRISSDAS